MFDTCRNLTYSLTHRIGAEIIGGRYSNDQSFPTEAELASEFNISRNIIRIAIKMLTAKGLLEQRPRRGITVLPTEHWNIFDPDVLEWTLRANPQPHLLREFTQLRIAIEPEAARLAAGNSHDDSVISPIELALKKMHKSFEENSSEGFIMSKIDFHIAILAASKNSYFLQMRQFIEIALKANISREKRLGNSNAVISRYYSYQDIFCEISTGHGLAAAVSVRELLTITMALIDD